MTETLQALEVARDEVRGSLQNLNGLGDENRKELLETYAELTDKIDPMIGQSAIVLASDLLYAHQ